VLLGRRPALPDDRQRGAGRARQRVRARGRREGRRAARAQRGEEIAGVAAPPSRGRRVFLQAQGHGGLENSDRRRGRRTFFSRFAGAGTLGVPAWFAGLSETKPIYLRSFSFRAGSRCGKSTAVKYATADTDSPSGR
jgi:hypothetical protein